jgi:hypothetical protein
MVGEEVWVGVNVWVGVADGACMKVGVDEKVGVDVGVGVGIDPEIRAAEESDPNVPWINKPKPSMHRVIVEALF